MITSDLISYIKKQQDNKISKDLIISNLRSVGWYEEDIKAGFEEAESNRKVEGYMYPEKTTKDSEKFNEKDYQSSSISDKYREPVDLDLDTIAQKEIPLIERKEAQEIEKNEQMVGHVKSGQSFNIQVEDFENNKLKEKIEVEDVFDLDKQDIKDFSFPVNEISKEIDLNKILKEENNSKSDILDYLEPQKPLVEPILNASALEAPKENNRVVFDEVKSFAGIKKEVVFDKNKEPLVESILSDKALEKPKEMNRVQLQENILNINKKEGEKKTENNREPLVESILSDKALEEPKSLNKIWLPKNIPVKEIEANKEEENSVIMQDVVVPIKDNGPEVTAPDSLKIKEEKDFNLNNLPKIVSSTTYSKDVLAALNQEGKKETNSSAKRILNKRFLKWIVVILAVIFAVGAIVWVLMTGKIDFKNMNIPFINKDPRSLILNNSKVLASLNSYKTETSLEIKIPSLANISAGLLTGEAIPSLDKDNLILNSSAAISQNEGKIISFNSLVVNGSILEDLINAKIVNDGKYLYLNFADLSKAFKENIPLFDSIKISEQEFHLVPPLFGQKIEKILNKINLYELLRGGTSSYIDQETLGTYDELIKNVQISKKGEESIKGVSTIHYSINPNKELFKNLMGKIVERFTKDINETDKINTDLLISSTKIVSFDVWIGKGDSSIYQYNLVLEIPMTKILGFEDKSIGNDTMSVSLKAIYFDFNMPNEIIIPSGYLGMDEFVKSTSIDSIKNKVKEFSVLANNLNKIEKKFGVKANTKGSCMSPVSGSLFSPTGHAKTASLPISEISLFLNYILDLTKGEGSCYSSPKEWSFAIPLLDNYDVDIIPEVHDRFYCIDSKGADVEITALPSGTTCEIKTEEENL